MAALVGLMRSFVRLGGCFLHIDVVDTALLLDAQRHPEKYPNLVGAHRRLVGPLRHARTRTGRTWSSDARSRSCDGIRGLVFRHPAILHARRPGHPHDGRS